MDARVPSDDRAKHACLQSLRVPKDSGEKRTNETGGTKRGRSNIGIKEKEETKEE